MTQECIAEANSELRQLTFKLEDINREIQFFGDNHFTPHHSVNEAIKKSWTDLNILLKNEERKEVSKDILELIMTSKVSTASLVRSVHG